MKVRYYSVEDVKAEQFGPLFPAKNDEIAKRMFKQLIKSVESEYWQDYFLHFILEFDDSNGVVDETMAIDPDAVVFCGSEFLEDKK